MNSSIQNVEGPIVGLVVPVRNRLRFTQRFLGLLEKQIYNQFHVYIVDSNSSDGTVEWVQKYSNHRVVLLQATDTDYWTGATNRGIQAAMNDGCKFVMTINDDSKPQPDFIYRMVHLLEDAGLDILAARVNYANQPWRVWSMGSFNKWGTHHLFQLSYMDWDELDVLADIDGKTWIPIESNCGNGVLIRSSVLKKIGLYDEKHYPHYHADSEFIMRSVKEGMRVAGAPYIVLFNDTEPYAPDTGEGRHGGVRRSPGFLSRVFRRPKIAFSLFFSKRSDRRLWTALHAIRTYGPRGQRMKTFVRYNGFTLFIVLPHRVQEFVRRTRRFLARTRAPGVRWRWILVGGIKLALVRMSSWWRRAG